MLVFGPLHPAGNVLQWMERMIRTILPHDAHRLASGRLAVAMTRVPDGKNTLVSKYESREDVIQVSRPALNLLFLVFILSVGYCALITPPDLQNVRCSDGQTGDKYSPILIFRAGFVCQ